mmetsp:Transcript_77597/g.214978  ORF Transcript_77597/g.214978 Transcript_77597/m.214978 type:complete len:229 (+) Transcript_77597:109-795(+)
MRRCIDAITRLRSSKRASNRATASSRHFERFWNRTSESAFELSTRQHASPTWSPNDVIMASSASARSLTCALNVCTRQSRSSTRASTRATSDSTCEEFCSSGACRESTMRASSSRTRDATEEEGAGTERPSSEAFPTQQSSSTTSEKSWRAELRSLRAETVTRERAPDARLRPARGAWAWQRRADDVLPCPHSRHLACLPCLPPGDETAHWQRRQGPAAALLRRLHRA